MHLVDADVDARLTKQLQASIDAIVAIPKPFEAAIVGDTGYERATTL